MQLSLDAGTIAAVELPFHICFALARPPPACLRGPSRRGRLSRYARGRAELARTPNSALAVAGTHWGNQLLCHSRLILLTLLVISLLLLLLQKLLPLLHKLALL